VYTVLVFLSSLLFGWAAGMGLLYWASAVVLGALFIWFSVEVMLTESPAKAIRLFTFSITYITLLFAVMAVDVLLRNGW